ncbi:unnamed protein product [Adineta ricciae]|uniref:Uncharacterized protein n=1 Tax=Adineta ricciae TaxID=249248 RepID=A0A815NMC1_ADIRI|nr:unnamed protein product [Adineta ricciae]
MDSVRKTIRDIIARFPLKPPPTSNRTLACNKQSKADVNKLPIPAQACQPLRIDVVDIVQSNLNKSRTLDTPNFYSKQ